MTANSTIENVTVYSTGTSTTMMFLYSNTTPGVTKFIPGSWNQSTGVCTQDISNQLAVCLPVIGNVLMDKLKFRYSGIISNMCLDISYCTSGEDCNNATCSTFGSTAQRLISSVVTVNSNAPQAPVLTVTPGDKFLDVSWNNIPDPNGLPSVWAYYFVIYLNGNIEMNGWLKGGTTAIRVNGLSNDKTYTMTMLAQSHNGVESAAVNASGIPTTETTESGSKASTYIILAGIGLAGLYYVTKPKSKSKTTK